MKQFLKIYFITVFVSGLCIAFPWCLSSVGDTSAMDVLGWQGILSGMVAIAFTLLYVFRKVKVWKIRVWIVLLNPAIYYIIVLAYIGISMVSETWHEFRLVP